MKSSVFLLFSLSLSTSGIKALAGARYARCKGMVVIDSLVSMYDWMSERPQRSGSVPQDSKGIESWFRGKKAREDGVVRIGD